MRAQSSPRLCVYVIEDNPLACQTLFRILKCSGRWRTCSYSLNSQTSPFCPGKPNSIALIIDRGSMRQCFSTCLRRLKQLFPMASIVAIDHPLAPEDQCALMQMGIHGFVEYRRVASELKQAIKAVCSRRLWFNPAVLELYPAFCRTTARRQASMGLGLTEREQQVVSHLQQGLSNREIGARLQISESTVKFHVAHILPKLGLRHRRHIVSYKLQTSGQDSNGEPASRNGMQGSNDYRLN